MSIQFARKISTQVCFMCVRATISLEARFQDWPKRMRTPQPKRQKSDILEPMFPETKSLEYFLEVNIEHYNASHWQSLEPSHDHPCLWVLNVKWDIQIDRPSGPATHQKKHELRQLRQLRSPNPLSNSFISLANWRINAQKILRS